MTVEVMVGIHTRRDSTSVTLLFSGSLLPHPKKRVSVGCPGKSNNGYSDFSKKRARLRPRDVHRQW